MEISRSILSTSQVVHCAWNHDKTKNEGASYQVSLTMWVYISSRRRLWYMLYMLIYTFILYGVQSTSLTLHEQVL